jgi:hypothetical protein
MHSAHPGGMMLSPVSVACIVGFGTGWPGQQSFAALEELSDEEAEELEPRSRQYHCAMSRQYHCADAELLTLPDGGPLPLGPLPDTPLADGRLPLWLSLDEPSDDELLCSQHFAQSPVR